MFWTILAWVLAPIGLIACYLLLSGNDKLEIWGSSICGACVTVGSFSFRLDRVCALLAIVTFSAEFFKLSNNSGTTGGSLSVEMQDRQMMLKLRHERNFWISLYMLSLWMVAARVASLVELRRKGRPKWE